MDSKSNKDANTSNNSIIILSDDEDKKASDSDSTDYEPEPKKSRVEDPPVPIQRSGTSIDANGPLLRPRIFRNANGTYTIPITDDKCTVQLGLGERCHMSHIEVRPITVSSNGTAVTTSSDRAGVNNDEESQSISAGNTVASLHQSLEGDPSSLASSRQTAQAGPSHVGPEPNVQRAVSPDMVALCDFASIMSQRSLGGDRRRRRARGNSSRSSRNENNSRQDHFSSTSSSSTANSSEEYLTDDLDPSEIPSDEYLYPPFPTRQRRNAIFARRDPPPSAQNEEDQFFQDEFEVDSVQDVNENPIEDGSSTSDAEDQLIVQPRYVVTNISPTPVETDNNFADNENMKSDVDSDNPVQSSSAKQLNAPDPQMSEKDKKWFCVQCKSKTLPYCRYCVRCFKIRRNWLPPRPASRRLKNRKTHLHNSTPNSLNNSTNSRATKSSDSTEGEDVVDGAHPCSSSQSQQMLPSSQPIDMNGGFLIDENHPSAHQLTPDSQPGNLTLLELFSPPVANNLNTTDSKNSAEIDSQSQSHSSSSQSQRSLFSLNSQNSCGTATQSSSPPHSQTQSPSPLPNKMTNSNDNSVLNSQCSICFVRAKDAAFVHNKIAHLYCCYTCADKILKKHGKCPICRERVLRVVKIISV